MVDVKTIINKAKEIDADIIGLSGLITPSLDEMIDNMKEFEHLKMTTPVLVGRATTSKAHTAIKIAPHYSSTVVNVGNASLVTNVCSSLLNPEKSKAFISE